ncbi:SDR family oxidoreductase [Pseudomonas asuensis]|jgi:glucose 1-dehydrogenase|uniref:Glucose-1-dehydrogenase n=1 Tax=Pseudomonas asuensis TaxID=1825787 RepID=A0ABQ2GHN3_9PSED|nr:SDR family oxidoreductase [Pseudomonas asuensis]GGL96977.1 glucose-1-dehydrogenase [Pseudomonas asuensis]
MKISLDGQVALVTGGSSGIGAASAKALAQVGAAVVINYHNNAEPAEKLVDEIKAAGGQAIAVKADVGDEQAVEQLFAKAIEAFGRLDILVANSGLQRDAPSDQMSLKDWNMVIQTNLTGQFLCARAAIQQFLKQGVNTELSRAAGKIIHMSSVHEVIPWAGHVNYAASKGGVSLMMKTLAQEMSEKRIRINSIAPGAIATAINEDVTGNEEGRRELLKLIPYKRVGEVEDIGNAVVWLASDLSDYVVGTTLFVDGGMCLYPGFQGNG